MISQIIVLWISTVAFMFMNKLDKCEDVIASHIQQDGLKGVRPQIENYPYGLSLIFSKEGYKYDYFLTVSPEMYQKALEHDYSDVGQCLINNSESVYFTKMTVSITEGA